MNKPKPEDFQLEPSFELMDEIYTLGKRAINEFGEVELGNYLVMLAFNYKTRIFELEQRRLKLVHLAFLEELMKTVDKEEVVSNEENNEVLDEIFKKIKIH